jgi:hypothetical protein
MPGFNDARRRNSAEISDRMDGLEAIPELAEEILLAARRLHNLAAVLRAAGEDSISIEFEDN